MTFSQELDTADMGRKLWVAVENLPDNLPEAVKIRYKDGMTLKEVGQSLGAGVERARQIEAKAMRAFRQQNRNKKFRAYYEQYLAAGPIHHIGAESFRRTHMSEVELDVLGWKCRNVLRK